MGELKPANQNPWYVLMMQFGEQTGDEIDWDLHEKNREAWNRRHHGKLSDSANDAFREFGLPFPSKNRYRAEPMVLEKPFPELYKIRNGETCDIPSPPKLFDPIEFRYHHFEHLICASGMIFPNGLAFDNCRFSRHLDLRQTGVVDDLRMSKCTLEQQLDAEKLFVTGGLRINRSSLGGLDLNGAKVSDDIEMVNIKVQGPTNLADVQVEQNLRVVDAKLTEEFACTSLEVRGTSYFANLKVSGATYFQRATFEKASNWQLSRFGGDVTFAGSQFKGQARFRAVTFETRVGFEACQFDGMTDFAESQFLGQGTPQLAVIRFNDSGFAKPTSFRHCVFTQSFPEFTNVDFHPVTDFTAETKNWPDQIVEPQKEARETCGIIRNLLTKKGLHEDQHFFFRLEMNFAAAQSDPLKRLTYWIYELLSDYGDSIQRPVIGLALVWALGFAAFRGYFSSSGAHNIWTAMGLSFSNLFPLFGFGRLHLDKVYDSLPQALTALSGFQTVVSLPLLFFLGLGLRQRFRVR